jgi:cytidine deaminase
MHRCESDPEGRETVDDKQLIEAAKKVRQRAHAPYSHYLVGAALIDDKGNLHSGCNVENAAYPEGNCAEANAIGAMVAAGGRKISVIAAVGGTDTLEFCTPCGGCRQSILEFSDADTRVILLGGDGEIQKYSIDELLPLAFRLGQARL